MVVSNVLLQDYVEVSQPWGDKNQYGFILLEHGCFLIPHTCYNNTDKATVLTERGSSGTFLSTQIKMIYDHSRHGLSEAAEL